MLLRGGDDAKHRGSAQEQAVDDAQRLLGMIRVQRLPAGLHDVTEGGARRALPQDEAPGAELAVVRHAHREAQDFGELFRRGAGRAHGLGGGRLAGSKEREDGRRIVELLHNVQHSGGAPPKRQSRHRR